MHIADGIVSGPVLAGGTIFAISGVALGLKKIEYDQVPQVAVLSAAFFVASLIHVPIGPGQVHLILNGLTGLILGWAAFPAILIALLLQSFLFGYGGITALGVNTFNMALPGVLCHYIFLPLINRKTSRHMIFSSGFCVGSFSIVLNAMLIATTLYFSNKNFIGVIYTILVAHLPIVFIEGILTGAALLFLKKVNPKVLLQRR